MMTGDTSDPLPRIDIHVHLAGAGTQGSGCWFSRSLLRRPPFLGMRFLLGISDRQMETTVDQDWAAVVSALVEESDLDLAVVLGFDGVYDSRGRLDRDRSQLIVPPHWVFETCRRYANLLPGPSINPYRGDALERLDESIEAGASLIKWLPIVQGFDPASPRTVPFLDRMASAGIPLLVHAGSGEVTFRTVDPAVGDLDHLVTALEMGVTVICAHAAAPIHFSPKPSQIPQLHAMLEHYPNLWVDNSGLANPSRWMHLPAFAADPLILERTLHGSDFPVPSTSAFYLTRLGPRTVAATERIANPMQKELTIKRCLGYPEESFTRAASVIANVDRWAARIIEPTRPTTA
jgi:uncharacterized protein